MLDISTLLFRNQGTEEGHFAANSIQSEGNTTQSNLWESLLEVTGSR